MPDKTLSFRLPSGWLNYLDDMVSHFSFNSRSELLSLILWEAVYNSIRGNSRVKALVLGEVVTVVVVTRVSVAIHQYIRDLCCRQIKNTPSVWAASAVILWLQALGKEERKQQKIDSYLFWVRDFAKDYRQYVGCLQVKEVRNC